MIQQLDSVRTVADLSSFIGRNAHNLSEVCQIQVEMQMCKLKRGQCENSEETLVAGGGR